MAGRGGIRGGRTGVRSDRRRRPARLVTGGYVQTHQVSTDVSPCPASVYEAVAEVWFDNLHTALGLADDPNYLAFVKDDELNFVDLTRLKWLYTDEHVLRLPVDPANPPAHADMVWLITTAPTTFKMLQFIEGDDPIDEARHADLAVRIGAFRATRCAPTVDAYQADAPAYGAVREFWWPTESAFLAGVKANPGAWAELLDLPAGSESMVAKAERFA